MKKSLSLMGAMAFSMSLTAQSVVDLYGENDKGAEVIMKKYGRAVGAMEDALIVEYLKDTAHPNKEKMGKLIVKKKKLLAQIKKERGYLYVDFDTVSYPGEKKRYTTIEVITKSNPDRLRFISPNTESKSQDKAEKHTPDLIDEMLVYNDLSIHLEMEGKIIHKQGECPVFHCTSGFNYPTLKPYLARFNTGVIKEKKLILETLKSDPSIDRRAAAIFLLAHLTNPREIISILTPYINDKSTTVRNNAMRVLAETLRGSQSVDFDAMPLLSLLDSPYETDRNKSLWMLYAIADSKVAKPLIVKHGGDKLIDLLKLKQPNNHEIAYMVLKKISGKDYGERNIAGWKKWLGTNGSQMT